MLAFVRAAVLACALSCLLGACSESSTPQDSMLELQKEYFSGTADAAENSGATRLQIDTLREAASTGELTPDMVTALYDPLFACLEAIGAEGQVEGTKRIAPGFSVPDYVISFDVEVLDAGGAELDSQVRECQDKHVEFVWRALYLQPAAVEARADEMMIALPSIRECLDGLGVDLADNPSPEQVQQAISEGAELGTRCFVPGDYGSAG